MQFYISIFFFLLKQYFDKSPFGLHVFIALNMHAKVCVNQILFTISSTNSCFVVVLKFKNKEP